MNFRTCHRGLLGVFLGVAWVALVGASFHAIAAEPPRSSVITLDQYLNEVKTGNKGVVGSLKSAEAGGLRSDEGKLLLSPVLYSDAKYTSDGKIPPFSFLIYDTAVSELLSVGVSQLTTFGLQGKLHYDLFSTNYNNASSPFFPLPSSFVFSYANASPVLELTQSLWSNGFGRTTRATQTQLEAQALASSYAASYEAKAGMSEAEVNYWRLAAARQTISVEKEALNRAQKILEWNTRRAQLHLGDEADVLQADALVKSRELDLMSAQNEERSASLAFNTSRNIDSDQVSEQLADLDPEVIEKVRTPARAGVRDDVKAAEQSSKASVAQSLVATEQDSPTLNLNASVALNGQQGSGGTYYGTLSQSIPASFTMNRPTYNIELVFNAPLDFGVVSRSKQGWNLEHVAADLKYDRKLFEQEQNWKDLSQSLQEAKQRFGLARKLEFIQKSKLNNEKDRLKHGRTTTYQVLLFEQDYLQAQLLRIQNQVAVLKIIAQMKLFGENV